MNQPTIAPVQFACHTEALARCRFCRRQLSDPVSIERDAGPVCARRFGISHTAWKEAIHMSQSNRADYHYELHGGVVVIFDHDTGGKTVTNDAEAVVAEVGEALGGLEGRTVIYRDSEGIFDVMLVTPSGRFRGFAPLGELTLDEALAALKSRGSQEGVTDGV